MYLFIPANLLFLLVVVLRSYDVSAHENEVFDLNFVAVDAAGTGAECHQCSIRDHHTGFTGAGFADFERKGAWLEFTADIPQTKTTNLLLVRYSAGNSDRPVDATIDGQPIGSLMFTKTKNWDTWLNEMIPFEPKTGSFKIRLEANESSGPNIDMILLFQSVLPNQVSVPEPVLQPINLPIPQSPTPLPLQLAPPKTPSPAGSDYNFQFFSVVLESGKSMRPGTFVFSPNGYYKFGMAANGDLQLYDLNNNVLVWQAFTEGATRAYMQQDGNFLTRLPNKKSNWKSATSRNPGAILIVDNGGQVAILHKNTAIWLVGIPRREYTGPPETSLNYPLRGAFYYAWYPETWSVNGKSVFYRPTLGEYSNGDPVVQQDHVDALDYIHVDVAIASWWGIEEKLERARLTNLLDKSIGTKVKWSVYHEMEREENRSPEGIREDLDYLKKTYAWHPSWAHIDDRPVIFVYNEGNCGVSRRWSQASNDEWYVVLKTFPGFKDCEFQPDHWHEYGPAFDVVHVVDYSFAVSPGFWRADLKEPRLPRVSDALFRTNVQDMVASNEDWQLITTFNEWGEGTAVEAAYDWGGGNNNYGIYMEALHDIHHRANKVERSFWT